MRFYSEQSFRDVLFWTALKHGRKNKMNDECFRDVLFWTALKPEQSKKRIHRMF